MEAYRKWQFCTCAQQFWHKQLWNNSTPFTIIIVDLYLSFESLLKRFGLDKSNKTVSCHEEVDGVLCFREGVFVGTFQVLFDFLGDLVVKVDLCRWVRENIIVKSTQFLLSLCNYCEPPPSPLTEEVYRKINIKWGDTSNQDILWGTSYIAKSIGLPYPLKGGHHLLAAIIDDCTHTP